MKIYTLCRKVKSVLWRTFAEPFLKREFASCGRNVRIASNGTWIGTENIYIGSNVVIGVGATVLSTRARVIIGNDVMFGPNVTVITGDHLVNLIGRTMISVTDEEKMPENDQDIIIENDVWIGANVTLLKNVTIHSGSVIAAGAVVTKDIPPYQIWGGVPARFIANRFNDDDLNTHQEILNK